MPTVLALRPRLRPRAFGAVALSFALAGAVVALPLAAPSAEANIPVTVVRGDVGLNIEYNYPATSAEPEHVGWSPAYPYRLITADDQTSLAYCVEWPIGTEDGVAYSESEWEGVSSLDKVAWILRNAAPAVSLSALTDAAEAHSGQTIADYNDFEARGLTQLAIWHYTDGFDFDRVRSAYTQVGGGSGGSTPLDLVRLRYLYDYLVDPAVNIGIAQPLSSLNLDDSAASWQGSDYGPVRVVTNAPSVDLSANSTSTVSLVDAAGTPVTTAVNGDEIYLRVETRSTPGSAEIAAEGPLATLATGRLLVAPGFQTLAVSVEAESLATAAVTVDWTAELASTGTAPMPWLLTGLVLILLGLSATSWTASRRINKVGTTS